MRKKWENPAVSILGVKNTEEWRLVYMDCQGHQLPNGDIINCAIGHSRIGDGITHIDTNTNTDYLAWRDEHRGAYEGTGLWLEHATWTNIVS